MVALMVRREFGGGDVLETRLGGARFEQSLIGEEAGTEIGSVDGAIRVLEFVDLQCPACAMYHREVVLPLLDGLADSGASVSFRVVLFPLPVHPYADVAAHAAACAQRQGRFGEYLSVALAAQREFATEPWARFANDAGVSDERAFLTCLREPGRPSLVSEGVSLAESAGIRATPTLAINGWVLPRPASKEELLAVIKAFLDGGNPFE